MWALARSEALAVREASGRRRNVIERGTNPDFEG